MYMVGVLVGCLECLANVWFGWFCYSTMQYRYRFSWFIWVTDDLLYLVCVYVCLYGFSVGSIQTQGSNYIEFYDHLPVITMRRVAFLEYINNCISFRRFVANHNLYTNKDHFITFFELTEIHASS